jgi:hypothetical protein
MSDFILDKRINYFESSIRFKEFSCEIIFNGVMINLLLFLSSKYFLSANIFLGLILIFVLRVLISMVMAMYSFIRMVIYCGYRDEKNVL